MTDQEINIAIYEALGATWWVSGGGFHYLGFQPANPLFRPCDHPGHFDSIALRDVPRYTSDLNAMHEAEKMFDRGGDAPESEKYAYSHNLYSIVVPADQQPFRATARQRAEAFLRTIGMWKEAE